MSILSGQRSQKSSRSSKNNGARIIAPNGSVISRHSDDKSIRISEPKSHSTTKKSSIQGSIISHTKSETLPIRSSKGGSVLSGVSSQVARHKKHREKLEISSNSMKERTMSATSLNRRSSNESQNMSSQSKRFSHSDVKISINSEIQSMTKEERNILLKTIEKYKMQQTIDKSRKTALEMKIKEIQSLRPPYSQFQSNICYICQRKFWPIFFVKYSCNRCRIFVCKNCLREYNNNSVCNQCFQEMIYLTKSDSLFQKKVKYDEDDEDSEDNIDIDAIKKIIRQTERNDDANSFNFMGSIDHMDAGSRVTVQSNTSVFKKLLHKRKDDTSSMSKSKSEITLESNHPSQDQVSLASMSIMSSTMTMTEEELGGSGMLRQGEIMIGFSYNFNTEEFKIIIKKCRNLEIAIKNQPSSNPYVKVNIIPVIMTDKSFKTKTIVSNLNPEYNEQCKYKNIRYDDIIARSVLATVFHNEKLGKDIFLGQAIIKISAQAIDDASPLWYQLKDKKPATIHPTLSKYYGDIQFSIQFSASGRSAMSENSQVDEASTISTSSGNIILWIKQANNLLTSSYTSLPNAYVKCILIPDNSKEPAKKSPIIRKNFNPIWNIPFPFNSISLEDLPKIGMEITVWDKKSGFLRDVFLGGVSLNISRSGRLVPNNEVEVWQRMIDRPEVWVEAKLVLRKDLK